MKTTVDMDDALLAWARRAAEREGTTLDALVERGLRLLLAEPAAPPTGFTLRRASIRGQGLHPTLQGAQWNRLRDLAYQGRGA